MLAVQKPPLQTFAAPMFHPNHSRHPSAPVIVRPTHTPGLLSFSKPAQPAPRPQTACQHQRSQRASPRGKPQQRSPQLARAQASDDTKKSSGGRPKVDSEKARLEPAVVRTLEKSSRGRQTSKAAKDKAQQRSASSSAQALARRPLHQSSPPPSTRIPSRAEVSSQRSMKSSHPSANTSASEFADPFVVDHLSHSDNASAEPAKAGSKGYSYRPPPPLSQPAGKLARRRQTTRASSTPALHKTCQQRKDRVAELVGGVADVAVSASAPITPPRRSKVHRIPVAADWDVFPICDDSSDLTDESDESPPSTPLREAATVPTKKNRKPWQHAHLFDDAPRTAPLSSTFELSFAPSPTSSPTPAHRRRHHQRAPSDGVFLMSTDDESSSSSDVFSSVSLAVPRHKLVVEMRPVRAPAPDDVRASSAPQPGFFAGSVFQSSPSPDELPPPSF
ncbi:uncharacterized protein LAESUDRAFT_132327 [Laetiporus sulphureus 93-53]|uniref:Uncharacterized protein n=1 Tax=Laetiporus sulphureus 93-53 TaxID=1314785 RepID=A0A165EI02_9APHY|nr:uncharacterized protein LAESUDRAFT_132327 [Laetiporus sulphureus 93-53]KZT07089.1 hypothetical protein LAESUDRAFT_132327 [Laetiporus sulphureus 93-53]